MAYETKEELEEAKRKLLDKPDVTAVETQKWTRKTGDDAGSTYYTIEEVHRRERDDSDSGGGDDDSDSGGGDDDEEIKSVLVETSKGDRLWRPADEEEHWRERKGYDVVTRSREDKSDEPDSTVEVTDPDTGETKQVPEGQLKTFEEKGYVRKGEEPERYKHEKPPQDLKDTEDVEEARGFWEERLDEAQATKELFSERISEVKEAPSGAMFEIEGAKKKKEEVVDFLREEKEEVEERISGIQGTMEDLSESEEQLRLMERLRNIDAESEEGRTIRQPDGEGEVPEGIDITQLTDTTPYFATQTKTRDMTEEDIRGEIEAEAERGRLQEQIQEQQEKQEVTRDLIETVEDKKKKQELKNYLEESKEHESYLRQEKQRAGKDEYTIRGIGKGAVTVESSEGAREEVERQVVAEGIERAAKGDLEEGEEVSFDIEEPTEVSEEAAQLVRETEGLEKAAITAHSILSEKGPAHIGAAVNPSQEEQMAAQELGLSVQEKQVAETFTDIGKVQKRSEEEEEVLFGKTPSELKYTGKSAVVNPLVEAETAFAGGAAVSAASTTAIGGKVLGSTAGKAALGIVGGLGIGARGYQIKELKEAGKHEEAVGKAFMTGVDVAAAVGGAKAQAAYQKPTVERVDIDMRTEGASKGRKAALRSHAGGRKSSLTITTKQNKPLFGTKTKEYTGYLDLKTDVSGKNFIGRGDFGYMPKSGKGPVVTHKKFDFTGSSDTKTIFSGRTHTYPYKKTGYSTSADLTKYQGKAPFPVKSYETGGVVETIDKPSVTMAQSGGASGKTFTQSWANIFKTEALPSAKDISPPTPGGGIDVTKRPFDAGGTFQGVTKLKGTFMDTGTLWSDTAAKSEAAAEGGKTIAGDLITRSVEQTAAPTTSTISQVAPAGAQQVQRRKPTRRTQPRLEEVKGQRAEQPTTPTVSIDEETDVAPITSLTTGLESIVGLTERTDVTLTTTPTTKTAQGQKTGQTTRQATQVTQPTPPQLAAPQPTLTSPTLGWGFKPDLPKMPRFGSGEAEDVTKETKTAYKPSVGGALLGERTKKVPEKRFTGLELRPLVNGGSKTKKKKDDLDKIIQPSGEI